MEALVLSAFGVYGVTAILTMSDGPFGIFYKLRYVKGFGGLHCFMCTSVYVAAAIALMSASSLLDWVMYTLGFSGVAIFAHNWAEDF